MGTIMNLRKVLVTGGAGFIGSHLVSKLSGSGHSVRVMDNLSPQIHGAVPTNLEWLQHSSIEFYRGSVTRREDWIRALNGVDGVVHLAAETGTGQSMYEIARYNRVNSQGTALLFDVLSSLKRTTLKRVILASSRSVYGEGAYVHFDDDSERIYPSARNAAQLAKHQWEHTCSRTGKPLKAVATKESDRVRPGSVYAVTKASQEDLVRVGCEALGIGYFIFRLQNVYGEGQSINNAYTGILSIFSTLIRRGQELPIFEDGKESRDFVHVNDVAEVIKQSLLAPKAINGVLNVGSGVGTSVFDVATILSNALGAKPNIKITGQYRIGDIRHNFADIEKLCAWMGGTPRISLNEGIQRLADWVVQQPLPEENLLERANQKLIDRKLMG
jgi:dTDP-L-rhamnose 4-epimerase